MLNTPFTQLTGCIWPICSAAMTGTASSDLASAVHNAGAFGFIACFDLKTIEAELSKTRELLHQPSGRLPIGIGFLGWLMDTRPELQLEEGMDLALQHVSAIWLSFGRDLGKYARKVKAQPDVKLFIMVCNVEEALAAVQLGADVLVAQGEAFVIMHSLAYTGKGTEAGGHGSSSGIPLLSFLPMLIEALPSTNRPVILAAGGIATGSQIAAAITLGADGVVMGTRFLPCSESGYAPNQKKAILEAKGNPTIRTFVFDEVTDMIEWPPAMCAFHFYLDQSADSWSRDGRALINKTFLESLDGKRSIEELKKEYKVALEGADTARMVVWAGTSVGLVNEPLSAGQVVEQLGQEALQVLRQAALKHAPESDAPRR